MSTIIDLYECSPLEAVRRAAPRAKVRLDVARAELARSAGLHFSAVRYHARAFAAVPSTRLRKETAASL
ncbi:MAG: hypothetical protein ACLPPF_18965 [Rhodomicrobium sp.]